MKKNFSSFLRKLDVDYSPLAREFQALSRSRKIQNASQLLRIIFLYSIVGLTMKQVSATFTLLHQELSSESIRKRLSSSVPFLQAILESMLKQKQTSIQLLGYAKKILAVDGTSFAALGGRGPEYRLHTAIRLDTLQLEQCILTESNVGEKFSNFQFEEGSLVLGDRLYCSFPHLMHLLSQKVDFLVRFQTRQTSVFCPHSKERITPSELVKRLKSHRAHTPITFALEMGSQKSSERPQVWMHAVRLPRKKAAKRRKQYRKDIKCEKRKHCKDMEYLHGWIIVLTNVEPLELSGKQALELYRHRWQIELYFKKLKSLLELDKLRAKKGSPIAKLWIIGKLIWAIILEREEENGAIANGYVEGRESSWGHWQFLRKIHEHMILEVGSWKEEHWNIACKKLLDSPRKRKLLSFNSRMTDLTKAPVFSRFLP